MEKLFLKNRELLDKLPVALVKCKVVIEKEEIVDFIIMEGNKTFEKYADKEKYQFINKKFSEVFKEAENAFFNWPKIFGEVAITQKDKTFTQYSTIFERYLKINVISLEREIFYLTIEDISLQKQFNDLLMEKQLEIEYLEKELKNKSKKDSLLNIYNQQVMIKKLKFKMENYKNDKEELICIILNIDRFDYLNYKYSIEFSNSILREVAEVLKDSIRKIDILGRIGNDEFLIILPNINMEIAKIIVDKIRSHIRTDIKLIPNKELTLSGGMLEYQGESLEEYYKKLKDIVKKAKKRGKDTILS